LREKKIILGHLMRIAKQKEYHKLSGSLKEVIDGTNTMAKNIQDLCFDFFYEKRLKAMNEEQERKRLKELSKLPYLNKRNKARKESVSPMNKDILSSNNNLYLTMSPKVE